MLSANNKTGWLQDPRPRPFYASAVEMRDSLLDTLADQQVRDKLRDEDYQPFALANNDRPDWQFFRIPDVMEIAFERIYVEP